MNAVAVDGPVAFGIMCKVPQAGTSKTRLTPVVSASEAATLSRCFIADLAATVAGLPAECDTRGYVVFMPTEAASSLDGLLPAGFSILPQRGDNLSQRCAHAVEDLLAQGAAAVCLLNADSPTLPASILEMAVTMLRRPGERVVLGPALDGGYYLIGLQRSVPELFQEMPWSTSRVLALTEARATRLGLAVERLPAWYDVDDGLSLALLTRELAGDGAPPMANGLKGAPAPQTGACLAALLDRGHGPVIAKGFPKMELSDNPGSDFPERHPKPY